MAASSLRAAMRARAVRVARRVASTALERLAREVDRLALALEPVREAMALRATGMGADELEVTQRAERHDAGASDEASDDEAVIDARASDPATATQARARSSAGVEPEFATQPHAEPATQPHAEPEPALGRPRPEPRSQSSTPSRTAARPEPSLGVTQANHLRARLEPHIAAIRAGGAWEQADDPVEALHQLRVATRRLRAFTSLFAPIIGKARARKLTRRLRAITRGLGPRREWDVLLEMLRAEHAQAEPLTQAALEHVIAWGEGQRGKATRKAHKALRGVDLGALADAMDAELDRVCGRMLRLDKELVAEAKAWLEAELKRTFEGMPRPEREDEVDAWHEVRKRAKQVRYALDLLRPVWNVGDNELRRIAKRTQRELGGHRDLALLAEHLRARRNQAASVGLETLARTLATAEASMTSHLHVTHENSSRAPKTQSPDSFFFALAARLP